MVMERAERDIAKRTGGMPNLTYDLVALLQEKLEAVATYEVYIRDAREAGHDGAAALFEHCRDEDRVVIERVRDLLGNELASEQTGDPTARTPLARGGGLPPVSDDSVVDEASMESFPASDAPPFSGSSIG